MLSSTTADDSTPCSGDKRAGSFEASLKLVEVVSSRWGLPSCLDRGEV